MNGSLLGRHPVQWNFLLLFLLLIALVAGALAFDSGLAWLGKEWGREEYSHGYLLVLVALFMVLQKRSELHLASPADRSTWLGWAALLAGLLALLLGRLTTLHIIEHYGLLMVIFGLSGALLGWRGVRLIWPGLLLLVFAIPLPPFLYNNLSGQLQLISSQIGVAVISLFDIPVYLEGNVIDLGVYQLQVVEACSGLRYLFPLMSFGYIAAYLYKGPWWHRLLVLLSTIPITVLMNSFRIGVIGVTVDRWGIEMAEGFLHDFEGWVIFMSCTAILLLEMWLLNWSRRNHEPFREVFGVDFGGNASPGAFAGRPLPTAFVASVVALVIAMGGMFALGERQELIPTRQEFQQFPLTLDGWKGKSQRIEDRYLDSLKLTDYHMADYLSAQGDWVNFYVAYYDSQRSGASAHSPRSCIPGDGWRISNLETQPVPGIEIAGHPLTINRVQIQKGDNRQLVYYWFQQRGRIITNEYLVKWYLFWDALTRNRSDGALVRFTTPLRPGEQWAEGDARIRELIRQVGPKIVAYVPE
ncbi:MAG: VPLPA-CTERM-specific exosortase XrtD [Pseudomonadales bacterium]|nr:VPLPA-CTERM-specific exosortase XrtD [Pseudomonadales bacterium]